MSISSLTASPHARAVWGIRDFRFLLISRILVTLAVQIQSVSVGWQVYAATNDPLDLGFVGLAQFLPVFLLAPLTGHVADRFPRRAVLMVCIGIEAFCAVSLLLLSFEQQSSVTPVFLVLGLFGAARAFAGPAQQSMLPLLVPREHFSTAVALSSGSFQSAVIAGPALGGLIYALGPYLAYGVCVALFCGTLFCIVAIAPPQQILTSGFDLENLLAGFRFVRAKQIILGAISLDLFAVLFGGVTALLPIYARDILHVGPWGLGLLRCAPAVGAVLVSLWLMYHPLRRNSGRTMFLCVGLFGLLTIIFALSENFWLSLAVLAILGAADSVSVIIRQTLIQLETPDSMRGRVSAVNMMCISASNELGEFESGLTAAWFGVMPAAVLGGVGTLLVVGLWAWRFPALRRADRLDSSPSD